MRRVHVLGRIVEVDRRPKLVRYAIDDGTGTLDCVVWKTRGKEDKDDRPCVLLQLSQQVRALGYLSDYREQRQITATQLFVEDDPNAEAVFWLETALAWRNVYSVPYSASVTNHKTLAPPTGPSDGAAAQAGQSYDRQRQTSHTPVLADTVSPGDLEPALLAAISSYNLDANQLPSSGAAGGGVTFVTAAESVRSDPRFARVTLEQFSSALQHLVASRNVLEVAPGVFRAC